MSGDRLLHAYERELRFLRGMAAEFAEQHPDAAAGLLLQPTRCEDPHVERLLEATAMLAARVQLRLDDDLGEVSDALLQMLYPHYLAPLPSLAVVQLEAEPRGGAAPHGLHVPRHTTLCSGPIERVRCRFRTAYPITLWPLQVHAVELVPAARLGRALPAAVRSAVQITLAAPPGVSLRTLRIDALTFYLPGDGAGVPRLYELLLRAPLGLLVQAQESVLLGPEHVRPVGLDPDEGLLDVPAHSFCGYRLLHEYFAFPEKFSFVELTGLDGAIRGSAETLRLSVLLGDSPGALDLRLGPQDVLLGCTPIVNLFPHAAEPIRPGLESEHEVIADARAPHAYEIHSVQRVRHLPAGGAAPQELSPLHSLQHGAAAPGPAWWAQRRGPQGRERTGSRTFLSLTLPALASGMGLLLVDALCTNRDLPSRLELGGESDFAIEGVSALRRIRCVRHPTSARPPLVACGSPWRLISHLALNHLSLATPDDPEQGAAGLVALRELLVLYDPGESATARSRIHGLVGLQTHAVLRPLGRGAQAALVRGIEVELEFAAEHYSGGGLFLLASVLERFFSLYASVNSFAQTVARVRGREEVLKRWPPRSGCSHTL